MASWTIGAWTDQELHADERSCISAMNADERSCKLSGGVATTLISDLAGLFCILFCMSVSCFVAVHVLFE